MEQNDRVQPQEQPPVSIVIPALHAASTLPATLKSIAEQDYPHIREVIVAAGDEETARVAIALGAVVVPNPAGTTPVGLNAAIDTASGEVIVRCDAHVGLPPGYVSRAIATLTRTGADNVGGMQVPAGSSYWERAIGVAMGSRLGAGDARYRIGGDEGPVETVYLGVFRRSTLERLGGYDELFIRNQDYELNHRIRQSGGLVWFDPQLKVEYRPRGSLGDLALQYYQYGKWKRRMARLHPGSLRLRQLTPPILVAGLTAGTIVGLINPWGWWLPLSYLLMVSIGGVYAGRRQGAVALGVPPAMVTMHLAWGIGFIRG